MVTESVILSVFGGLLGFCPSPSWERTCSRALRRTSIPLLSQIQIDLRVFLFTLILAVLTGIGIRTDARLRGIEFRCESRSEPQERRSGRRHPWELDAQAT